MTLIANGRSMRNRLAPLAAGVSITVSRVAADGSDGEYTGTITFRVRTAEQ